MGLQIVFKCLDSYYPLPDSMYKCALSQSSHVDWQRFKERLAQTLIQRTPGQTLIRWVDWISVYLSEPSGPDVESLV